MMVEEPSDIASLFETALELDSKAREEFVRRCDEQTARELKELLSLHDEASGFLSKFPFERSSTGESFVDAPREPSVFLSLGRSSDLELTHVVLPDEDSSDANTNQVTKKETTWTGQRYQMESEIARGGMGVILRGRDVDLGRPVAIKRLLENHRDNPSMIQRFVEEAQIGGQLQHPGIAPIYGLGHTADLPFFTMKLVKGKTLAALLAERQTTDSERSRFLGIFEQICQAIAYAHSRGVIHRDLKPANVMVGTFGEVQVMDWGLAKVLQAGGVADEKKARETHHDKSIIQTIRSIDAHGSTGSDTQMGSVMGTPAYMPPEQALGEVDRLDERCDVFGLGAILCEILTGKPPYVAETSIDVFRHASRGKLDACFQRLESTTADEELIRLVRDCLDLEPMNRPRTAGVVSKRIADYLTSVEARLREAEVQRAAQTARVIEERKRGKTTLAFAASTLLMLVVGVGGWWWTSDLRTRQQLDATRQFNAALTEARLQLGRADRSAVPDTQRIVLGHALVAARQAVEIANRNDVERRLHDSAAELVAQLEQRAESAKIQALVAAQNDAWERELLRIRIGHADAKRLRTSEKSIPFDADHATQQYRRVFAEIGVDFHVMRSDDIAKVVNASAISESIIVAMDHWVSSFPATAIDEALKNQIQASLADCDTHSWRSDVRTAISEQEMDRVRELLMTDDPTSRSPAIRAWSGAVLRAAGELELSVDVLRAAQREFPGDFWLNFELSQSLADAGRLNEAIGFARAAAAIRPQTPISTWAVASILERNGESAEAAALVSQTFADTERHASLPSWISRWIPGLDPNNDDALGQQESFPQ